MSMKCIADMIYDEVHALCLDLYLPETLMTRACVIYAHDGGFCGGSKHDAEVVYVAEVLTRAGFAVAAVDMRSDVQADALSDADAQAVADAATRSTKIGLNVSRTLCGVGYQTAIEDLSHAVKFMKHEADALGIGTSRIGVLGHGSGGIAALGLAFAPSHMVDRVEVPEAVAAVGAALVQPWRMQAGASPCLLFAAVDDIVVPIEDVRFGQARAEEAGAAVRTIEVEAGFHEPLIDTVLERRDVDGTRYSDLMLAHFQHLTA